MNIVEIKTFKFDELSHEAQQVATDQYRESDHLYDGWYEHIEQDFHIENEYEYQNSDECIKENIISNEYDFLENGKQYY